MKVVHAEQNTHVFSECLGVYSKSSRCRSPSSISECIQNTWYHFDFTKAKEEKQWMAKNLSYHLNIVVDKEFIIKCFTNFNSILWRKQHNSKDKLELGTIHLATLKLLAYNQFSLATTLKLLAKQMQKLLLLVLPFG